MKESMNYLMIVGIVAIVAIVGIVFMVRGNGEQKYYVVDEQGNLVGEAAYGSIYATKVGSECTGSYDTQCCSGGNCYSQTRCEACGGDWTLIKGGGASYFS